MGGNSAEKEISILTGRAVEKALISKGYSILCMDINNNFIEKLKKENIKVVFNAMHGTFGEDGCIQGLLEVLGIAYTGSGVLASALAMNKVMAKRIFINSGLETPIYQVIKKEEIDYKMNLKFPIVVKPVSQGSACGVNIAGNNKELKSAIKEALELGEEVLIEKYIPGRELTVSILNDETLPVIEIIPRNKFYDYEAKYTKGMSEHVVPAKISRSLAKRAQSTALCAYRALGCRDYSRVDLRLFNNDLYILEVNTLPGMTDLSLFPDAAKCAGIDFPDLVEKILKMAIKRVRSHKSLFRG
ncbi:MAG: D-alanine--D-alanine ligase [Candidatus Firestonebacteria bacterium]|nr:D-alanine--D-alanine ligase [Candidatus Firestonebacteria bacterium]